MIARIRGEHHMGGARWRPTVSREVAGVARAAPVSSAPARGASWRGAVVLLAAAAAIAAGGLMVGGELSSGQGVLRLPASPRAWLDAYEAAAVDNPSRVCSELFSPQLAKAYARATGRSCTSYFEQITSVSVVVRRVLADGNSAVLELRQTVRPRDWAVVLSRRKGGWQAVDLLPGEPLR